VLATESETELIEFAKNHSTREVEQKLAQNSEFKSRVRKIEVPIETQLRRAREVMKKSTPTPYSLVR
jgi:hypothetical protein